MSTQAVLCDARTFFKTLTFIRHSPAGGGAAQPTPLPLLNGTKEGGCTIIEQPAGLHTLTQRYVDRAAEFIGRQSRAKTPFVLYVPFTHVHNPQFCADRWCNTSQAVGSGPAVPNPDAVAHGAGIGSSVQEMDDAVGQVRVHNAPYSSDLSGWSRERYRLARAC